MARRVVTAVDQDGRSYVARDEALQEMDYDAVDPAQMAMPYPRWGDGEHPGISIVWGSGGLPFEHPVDPGETPSGALPGPDAPHALRVSSISYPPGWEGELFWTLTTDLIFVISGELTQVLDGGDEVTVGAGDVLIQNGTNKRMCNRGDVPANIGVVMCAAVAAGRTPPADRQAR
jgi:hypothetical protein